uniref:cytochrome c oxidase subunit III n=1 Tax=Krisna quadrimaculosus TaxID=3041591 RepID=UPI002551D642|nr:cytochrome c oxidase subunit III [Krisna quadrimaculosus]WGG89451.1 cytochrome c oxidase subunit 3 [Krisna quadrimaculosus]
MNNHPYHMVNLSPWPITSSLGIFTMMMGTVTWMKLKNKELMMIGTMMTITCVIQWWRDITRESTFQGNHTKKIMMMMKTGMILFITSEIFFFISFFWSFFHSSLSPNMEMGMNWPPEGIKPLNPMSVPMLNTMILLSSGMSITWAHNSMLMNKINMTKQSMLITMILGVYFTIIQMMEYYETSFSMADSIYGSTFFMMTGFHGIHVMIGTVFIIISFIRIMKMHMSKYHNIGFELSAWYWHFVDLVWLFLYISVYWWGT